ncbi:MAG: PQQ-like beta-propeller repeat protein [Prevotellaceae bacterium]|jgi:outer membrane protein assembly factor BamB|nr:PQQ-like beta-propeller repeat protein [Prevotellaceae bacterium]
MYALNAETGAQLWSVPTAGTGSRMSYLNGVVYMVGGSGGGRLFAIEASTGKMLWKIDAGLLGEGSGARFRTNAVYVLPAKDKQPAKVIALSNMYAYCFEAER